MYRFWDFWCISSSGWSQSGGAVHLPLVGPHLQQGLLQPGCRVRPGESYQAKFVLWCTSALLPSLTSQHRSMWMLQHRKRSSAVSWIGDGSVGIITFCGAVCSSSCFPASWPHLRGPLLWCVTGWYYGEEGHGRGRGGYDIQQETPPSRASQDQAVWTLCQGTEHMAWWGWGWWPNNLDSPVCAKSFTNWEREGDLFYQISWYLIIDFNIPENNGFPSS